MKIDKQKIMEKVNSVSAETKKVTTDFAHIAKSTVKKVSDDIGSKIENIEVKSIVSEQDISKMLDSLYGNVLSGLGKASPPVEEFANDLSTETVNGKGDADTRKKNVLQLLNFFPVYGAV